VLASSLRRQPNSQLAAIRLLCCQHQDAPKTRSQRTTLVVAFCLIFAAGSSAQFLAGQTVDVDTYNDELYLEGAGSYQRIVYEDAMNSTMVTNMIWSEIYVAPCGTRPVVRIQSGTDLG
jgi:hypothetical protein